MILWVFEWVVIAGGLGGAICWIFVFLQMRFRPELVPALCDQRSEISDENWPGLSVIFAARDEAGSVAEATRLLLSQDIPSLRLIAVDDRSRDGTGEILDAIAAQDSRLHVVHVHELPDGWLGKCHALQRGAEEARAEDTWLLFTDADVMFAPGSVRRAIAYAVEHSLDHLTLTPDVPTEGFLERVFMTMFSLLFAAFSPPWLISNPRKKAAIGVGAFNLVRAESFQAVGGYRNIRLSVDDDMRLGQVLKFAGYRNRLLSGRGDVRVRWHTGARNMILGLEKNFFAALDFRLAIIPFVMAGTTSVTIMPFVTLLTGPWWVSLISAAGIASACGIIARTKRQSGLAWYHALFLPLGGLMVLVAISRSTFLTLKRRGVTWRDHLYPLPMLKEHVRRRNAWLKELWCSTR